MITVTPQPSTNITTTPGGSTAITFASPQAITVELAAAIVVSDSSSTTPLPSLPAAVVISALRMVSAINGAYIYANPNDVSAGSIAGIAMQSVNIGQILTPVINQPVTDQSWNWVRGSPVFLGVDGTLTQTPPVVGYLVAVARVLSTNTLFIEIQDIIQL
jgi:hypothetical protein